MGAHADETTNERSLRQLTTVRQQTWGDGDQSGEITAAMHGAKVIVDEKGTEAAAATAMAFEASGPPPADLTVVADHPFLWTIIHEPTGTILFVGRLVDPTT